MGKTQGKGNRRFLNKCEIVEKPNSSSKNGIRALLMFFLLCMIAGLPRFLIFTDFYRFFTDVLIFSLS